MSPYRRRLVKVRDRVELSFQDLQSYTLATMLSNEATHVCACPPRQSAHLAISERQLLEHCGSPGVGVRKVVPRVGACPW